MNRPAFYGCLAFMAVLTGCFSNGASDSGNSRLVGRNIPRVRFSELKASLLLPHCISCHAGFGFEKGIAPFVVPGKPEESPLYESVASGRMPGRGSPLQPALIELMKNYVRGATASELGSPVIDLKNVSFASLRSGILEPRCVSCHSKYGTRAGVLADIEPGDPADSILYNYVASGAMPGDGYKYASGAATPKVAGPLSENNIAAIRAFIRNLPPRSYPRIAPTWASLRANLFQRSCVTCHSPGGPAEDNPLQTYEEVSDLSSPILSRLQSPNRRMPAAHTTFPPSPELIRAFIQWVKAGKPR